MIIATAIKHNAQLISLDGKFSQYAAPSALLIKN